MQKGGERQVLGALIETLIEESDPLLRDRILFEAAKASGAARAVGLWREADPDGSGRERRWIGLYASAASSELPTQTEIEGVAEGTARWSLPHGREVWVAGDAGRRVALTLSGSSGDESVDGLEALFQTYVQIERADERALESIQDWLPGFGPEARSAGEPERAKELRHDLRNLLGCIRTTQDLLDEFGDGLDGHERGVYADTLERELKRAGDLVLSSLRDPSGPPVAAQDRLPLARVAGEVVEAECAAWNALGLDLHLEVEAGTEQTRTPMGAHDLARVLLNLVRNAREALSRCAARRGAPLGARLRISNCAPETGMLRVELEDDGPGLPPIGVERLFEPGVSLSEEPDRGLGLAVARQLIVAGGGRLWAVDRPEGGATFGFALPRLTEL